MNAAPGEPRPPAETNLQGEGSWPRHRWCLLIVLVFAAHVGLIFALGDHKPIVPRPPGHAPELRLVTGRSELLALNDPTLFARPHPKAFTGAAWLQISPTEFPPFRWSESSTTNGWPLAIEELGGTFVRFVQTNTFTQFDYQTMPVPELALPERPPEFAPLARSVLRVAGDLAERQLLSRVELPSRSSADLLTNSVVHVLVDGAGNVVSPLVQGIGSKSADQQSADQRALDLAKAMRFAPVPRSANTGNSPLGRLTGGALIFEWHTVPLPVTNVPPANR